MLGWGNKALRGSATEAPGGGRGRRCVQQAGATATVILERYLVIFEKCYAVTHAVTYGSIHIEGS